MATPYRIVMEVEARSRAAAIEQFEQLVITQRQNGWVESACGGGGSGVGYFSVNIGWKPQTDRERIEALERRVTELLKGAGL